MSLGSRYDEAPSLTIFVFLAETPGSATIEDQKAHLGPDDLAVLGGNRNFSQLGELLETAGSPLQRGDRIKIHNFNCLSLSTDMLVRALTKLLRKGVSFEVTEPGIVVEPGDTTGQLLLAALDAHYRHIHGLRTHAETGTRGRQPSIRPDQIPAIRARMEEPGMTAAAVAQELGIGRSTLFSYLERFGNDGTLDRSNQTEQRRAEDAGD